MMFNARMSLVIAMWSGIGAASGCDREAGQAENGADDLSSNEPTVAASNKANNGYRNACDLLTVEEVSAAAGVAVTVTETSDADGTDQEANESNRLAERSGCTWEGPDTQPALLMVKAYWVGGKQQWKINAMAQGMAEDMIEQQEGVALDSVVKTGPVAGLGDKANFGGLLGSAVLKDDILLQITMLRFPNPEAQFRPLATKMLSRL